LVEFIDDAAGGVTAACNVDESTGSFTVAAEITARLPQSGHITVVDISEGQQNLLDRPVVLQGLTIDSAGFAKSL
jgi:hypothetical protein